MKQKTCLSPNTLISDESAQKVLPIERNLSKVVASKLNGSVEVNAKGKLGKSPDKLEGNDR